MTDDSVAVIVERIDNVKSGQETIKKEFLVAQERAEAWRERFDQKLADRPCEKHMGFFKAIDLQLKALWAIVAIVIAELIREHLTR
jgi:hypothetical protein